MRQRTAESLIALTAGFMTFVMLFLFFEEAGATYNNDPKQEQDQTQSQSQGQEQTATGGSATSNNDGNTLDAGDVNVGGDQVENNASTVVLVPNNNTESCVRVFGLAFGKNGESGAIGFPWRSAKCDFEQAADDAFAAGERDLGWFWKCENPNLYKTFMSKGETAESAKSDCHARMLATTSTDDVVTALEDRLKAAENLLQLERSHKAVCDESLDRCEDRAYSSK